MGDAGGPVGGGEQTVVVVDDDPEAVGLASTYVRRVDADVTVWTETDPVRALEYVVAERPRCVVSDYEMPEMDGIEFLTAVRERHPDVPFVLFTGVDDREIAARVRDYDATYLQKASDGYRRLQEHVAAVVGD
ncbi:MAG: response regulator transcription factor [Haloarculaceae archaeon]